jgi:GTP-binding protein Era
LCGVRVALVDPTPGVTRDRRAGAAKLGDLRFDVIDTAGLEEADPGTIESAMQAQTERALGDADVGLLLIDARDGLNEANRAIVEGLEKANLKVMLAINKIDTVPREKLLLLADELNKLYPFTDTFMISAMKGHGVQDLKQTLADRMPPGPWLYPEDQVADLPLRMLAAEITREKLFLRLHDELPYASTVETETWQERKDGSVRIEQVVFVERDSQKKIVLGKNGQTIKAIGQAARTEIAEALGQKVHLFLFVKVREKWAEDPERLRMMGLDPSR